MASLSREVEFFISDSKAHMDDEVAQAFREMPSTDQRRVVAAGPLRITRNVQNLFRNRIADGLAREAELAGKKGEEPGRFAKQGTEDEVAKFITANHKYLDEADIADLKALSPEDRWRVIADGPLALSMDAKAIVEHRARQGRDIENNLVSVFQERAALGGEKRPSGRAARAATAADPSLAGHCAEVFTSYVGKEVPEHLRRTAGFAVADASFEDKSRLVGAVKGTGGVVQILKAKYGCSKMEKYRVVGDSGGAAGIWKLEGEKCIPKTHLKQGGWKWVLQDEEVQPPPPCVDETPTLPPPPPGSPKEPSRECSREGGRRAKSQSSKRPRSSSRGGGEGGSGKHTLKRKKATPKKTNDKSSSSSSSSTKGNTERCKSTASSSGHTAHAAEDGTKSSESSADSSDSGSAAKKNNNGHTNAKNCLDGSARKKHKRASKLNSVGKGKAKRKGKVTDKVSACVKSKKDGKKGKSKHIKSSARDKCKNESKHTNRRTKKRKSVRSDSSEEPSTAEPLVTSRKKAARKAKGKKPKGKEATSRPKACQVRKKSAKDKKDKRAAKGSRVSQRKAKVMDKRRGAKRAQPNT